MKPGARGVEGVEMAGEEAVAAKVKPALRCSNTGDFCGNWRCIP
jgi:hypothetical protein